MLTETLFLHERPNYLVEYNLSVGTYSWQAPDAWNLGSGTEFPIDIWLWAGGAGGSSGSNRNFYYNTVRGGGGGGGGGFIRAQVRVVVGQAYTFSIGAGGAGNPTRVSGGTVTKSPGQPGGNTGMSDSLGSILYATGGQVATHRSYGSVGSNYVTGGIGGSGIISQPTKVLSYTIVNGGRAENASSGDIGSQRTNVAPVLDQPGGLAIQTSPNGVDYSSNWRGSGCGGPSVHANGGRPGAILYTANSGNGTIVPGSGGGAGYFVGGDGLNNISSGGVNNNYYMASGKGGNGYLTFSFMVQDGGSAGSAPQ